MKNRKEYAYVAYRIDPDNIQNLGDYKIIHLSDPYRCYHYNSQTGRLVNRQSLTPVWSNRGRIYAECMKAIGRLHDEEVTA